MPDRQKLDRYLDRLYKSAWLTNGGELVQELESRLAQYLGVRHVIVVGNGTLALQVAYRALDIRGEVITTPFSFVATASSLVWEGCRVKFADIEAATMNISPDAIERAITKDTRAIVPVHVYGNPCDVARIGEIAKAHDLKLVYDAAHAFGVADEHGSVLNCGDVSTLSFHATKLLHTVEGGAILTNDDEVAARARKLINFGIVSQTEIECVGINAKMNELEAAVGLCVLDDIDDLISARQRVCEQYDRELASLPLQWPQWHPGFSRNYHYYPVVFRNEAELLMVTKVMNEREIYPRRYFYPSLDTLDFLSPQAGSVSQDIAKRVLCLPLYPGLSTADCSSVVEPIAGVMR